MNKRIAKGIAIGLGLYISVALIVIAFYPDDPNKLDWEDRQDYNKVQIPKLKLGTRRQEIIAQLGSPDISEAKRVGNEQYQVMFYRTDHRKSDGVTTMDECTPLLFENDILVAWGEGAYKDYLSY